MICCHFISLLVSLTNFQVTIVLQSTKRDHSSVFRVQDVNVKIGSLKFAIRDSKHDFLYKTLRPLATALVKKQIQKAIRDTLKTGLEYIDGQLVAVRDRMAEAKATEGQSRTEVLKDVGLSLCCESIVLSDINGTTRSSSKTRKKMHRSNLRIVVVHTSRWSRTKGTLFLFRMDILQGGSTEPQKSRRAQRQVIGGSRKRKLCCSFR